MKRKEPTTEEKHQLYERFLSAIFGERVLCYPYIYRGTEEGKEEIFDGEEFYPVQKVSLDSEIQKLLGTLSEREKTVLTLHFGLEDGKSRTQKEVGQEQEFKVTPSRIRQIETKALRKCRHPSRSDRLKEFFVPSPEEIWLMREKLRRLDEEITALKERR